MARPEKEAAIEELKSNIESSSVAIMTKYQGITVEEVTSLRSKLRAENIKFKVFKNTLAKRALDELELSDAASFMEGPTVWAFGEDPVSPAKILKDFGKDVEALVMVGGVLDGEVVTSDMLNTLADLPSREQLLTQIAGTIAMPLRNLVGALNAIPRKLVYAVDAVKKQKEEAEAA